MTLARGGEAGNTGRFVVIARSPAARVAPVCSGSLRQRCPCLARGSWEPQD